MSLKWRKGERISLKILTNILYIQSLNYNNIQKKKKEPEVLIIIMAKNAI